MTNRRQFLQISAAVGVGSLIRWQIDSRGSSLFQAARALAASGRGQTPLAASVIAQRFGQFVQPLTTFGDRRVNLGAFHVGMVEFQQKVLPDAFYGQLGAPAPGEIDARLGTYVWGYQVGSTTPSYPASTIVATRGKPTTITYVNSLPIKPFLQKSLTVDQTIHFADPLGQMGSQVPYAGPPPGVVHLHGAEVPSAFDGNPEAWWTPDGRRGEAYSSFAQTDPNAAIYFYPNPQPATTLWFHDHALGMTRVNVLSGLAGAYLIRDQFDTGLANNPLGLPAGDQEVELILQDRQFDTQGQWYFPDGTEPDPSQVLNGDPPNPGVHPFWVPEFFGDTIVVNGRTWPFLKVEPRRYRFRVINGSNARFFRMALADSTTGAAGPVIWQIGTDGGLLDRAVKPTDHEDLKRLALFLAPGERADIIVDFAGMVGKSLTLTNDAQFPFPSGGPVTAGLDGRVMQFQVTKPLSSRDTTFNPATPATGAALRGGTNQPRSIVRLSNPTTGGMAAGITTDVVRQLVLVEVEGPGGPIEVLLNNTKWNGLREGTSQVAGGPGAGLDDAGNHVTEQPRLGATEVWEILNLTQDAHPIHLHLIQFQLRNRQAVTFTTDPVDGSAIYTYRATYDSTFPGGKFTGMQPNNATWGPVIYAPGAYIPGFGPPQTYTTPNADGAIGGNPAFKPFLTGPVIVPEAGEVGWKDTIKAYPGYVTRIVARWTPQETAIADARPGQNAFPFDPTRGPGYVWHCHILDHEDNEMMRPLKPVS